MNYPRSRSTLLRRMMDAHPDLAISQEASIWSFVAQAERDGVESLRRMVDWPGGFSGWENYGLGRDDMVTAISTGTVPGAVRSLGEAYARLHSKPRWGDRSCVNRHYIPLILRTLPDARIIHLVRRGEDVAVSMTEQVWTHSTDREAIYQEWKRETEIVDSFPCLRVCSESLVTEPEAELRRICSYCGVGWSPSMLEWKKGIEVYNIPTENNGRVPTSAFARMQRFINGPLTTARIGLWDRQVAHA